MPIDIRAVLTSSGLDAPGTGLQAGVLTDWTADAAVCQIARAQEAWGFDSTLVAPSATASDPAVLASFALAATSEITVIADHRIGIQQPTHAARAFATRSLLSGGRGQVLLLDDHPDGHAAANGDPLSGDARARRALEYAELFRRELESAEPFDFDGEFYTVRDAFSGIKPPAQTGTIAAGGANARQIELAARFADIYALPAASLQATAELIDDVRTVARGHGRELGFWRQGNVILASTDAAARERAQQLAESDRTLVGSVDTVASLILDYYGLGVRTVTLGGLHGASAEQRGLLAALMDEIRTRVELLDAPAVNA